MAPPIIVTEDTPPDMLAGSMDLSVVLPDGHSLKMSVERSTPMMDLLVQVTTANRMSPAGYIIKPLNDHGPLPYKPSTPIGALDTWTIHIVPKQHGHYPAVKKPLKTLNQPFEQTFRLQIHLPRNQLYVARISPKTRLADILLQVCSEKNLDPLKYSLRHPNNLDQVLSLSCALADYKLQEVTLVCNRSHPVEVSTVDIMSLQRETSNPAYRNTLCEGSVSSGSLEGRSLSPVPSDESSASPPPLPPSRPTRKRRPAPKPPTVNKRLMSLEKQENGVQPSTAISHSRNSSDSSGYHEASVLSESPQNNSVPESLSQHKMASVSEAPQTGCLSQSMTDIAAVEPSLQQATSYNSITSLSSGTGRKKKTAPPPPLVTKNKASSVVEEQQRTPSVSSTASSTTTLDGNEVNAAVKSATLPPSSYLNSEPKELSSPPSPHPNTIVDVEPHATSQVAPAPRPRSVLFVGSEQECCHNYSDTKLENKPSNPKKLPIPLPKPRKLLLPSSKSLEENADKKGITEKTDIPEEIKSPKRQSVFMNKALPNSVFNTHKACIGEMVIKFDLKDPTDSVGKPAEAQKQVKSENEKQQSLSKSDSSLLEINYEDPDIYKLVANKSVKIGEECDCRMPENVGPASPAIMGMPSTAWGPNTGPDACFSDVKMEDDEIDRIFTNATKDHAIFQSGIEECQMLSLPRLPSPPSSTIQSELKQPFQNEEPLDWEYKLPAPPTFRDETKSPTVTEFGTVTIGNFSDVICSESLKQESLNKTDLEKIIECEDKINEGNESVDCVQLKPLEYKLNCINSSNDDEKQILQLGKSSELMSVEHKNNTPDDLGDEFKSECVEYNLINELPSSITQRPNKVEITDVENKQSNQRLSSSSTLDNFKITTYKDTKPIEVFEDDSIKSSVGEKRDKSKDDAAFRAPKPRVKEPNLSRTSSFSMENKLNAPVIKRSVSYVSLLAANMPRNSQPYRAHLLRQQGKDSQDLWPRLRKTTSELQINNRDDKTRETSFWQEDPSELQSVQVLRNILSRSHANLTSSLDEPDSSPHFQQRDPTYDERVENKSSKNVDKNWGRSQSENVASMKWIPKNKLEHSASLDQEHSKSSKSSQRGPPSINLSTWSERPKRQIIIKNDCDYTSGFGKKSIGQDEITTVETINRDSNSSKTIVHSTNGSVSVELITRNEGYKMEGKSKSVSDLSRIPIVRAVELKKPFTICNFGRTSLKPVQILEVISNSSEKEQESLNSDDLKNTSDDYFIGVNSLAKRFGVPHKRPSSIHVSTANNGNNSDTDIKESSINSLRGTFISNKNNSSNVYVGRKIDGSTFRMNKHFEEPNESRHSKVDTKTSEIKALARRRSGGLTEDFPVVTSSIESVLQPPDQNYGLHTYSPKNEDNLSNISSLNFSNFDKIRSNTNLLELGDSKSSLNSNIGTPSSATHKVGTSGVYTRKSQTLDRNTRPLNLQPVVKGFRGSRETSYSLSKDVTSPSYSKAKDFTAIPNHLSSNFTNSDPSLYKATYHRALSSPTISSLASTNSKESAKDKCTDQVYSVPSSFASASKDKVKPNDVIPAPPPFPVLKPVCERKGVRLLPPPEANPRDQLMQSIRGFGIDSLKKVKETKSRDK